jgi:aspartate 1-decarboxylase
MPRINAVLDARSLTNYRQSCIVDEDLMKNVGAQNSRDFKIALMNNGTNIIAKQNQMITTEMASLAYGPFLG